MPVGVDMDARPKPRGLAVRPTRPGLRGPAYSPGTSGKFIATELNPPST